MNTAVNLRSFSILLCLFSSMILQGCTGLGHISLQGGRPAYNKAIQKTEKEELLLNIVRVRYGEPLKFLQVASVVSTFNYVAGLNANATLPSPEIPAAGLVDTFNIGGALNYAEAPTVTYVPIEGPQFDAQILQESSVSTLMKLVRGGWSVNQAIPLMVSNIGPLYNQPGTAAAEQFMQFVNLLGAIQARGDLRFASANIVNNTLADGLPASAANLEVFGSGIGTNLSLRPSLDTPGTFQLSLVGTTNVFEVHYESAAEAAQMAALLGTSSTADNQLVELLAFVDPAGVPVQKFLQPVTHVDVTMRALSDQLVYLAGGVAVPAADQGITLSLPEPSENLLQVRHSGSRPANAFAAVEYEGGWYYIPKNDVVSKSTFALLLSIYSLQTAGGGAAPGLTLGIGM